MHTAVGLDAVDGGGAGGGGDGGFVVDAGGGGGEGGGEGVVVDGGGEGGGAGGGGEETSTGCCCCCCCTSTVSIMPKSSCRRKWQCSTVSPGKSVALNRTVSLPSNVGTTSRHSPTVNHAAASSAEHSPEPATHSNATICTWCTCRCSGCLSRPSPKMVHSFTSPTVVTSLWAAVYAAAVVPLAPPKKPNGQSVEEADGCSAPHGATAEQSEPAPNQKRLAPPHVEVGRLPCDMWTE